MRVTIKSKNDITLKSFKFLFAVMAYICSAASFVSAVDISTCTVISTPGTYTLTNNIIDSTSTNCIQIKSSNVTLEGGSHRVVGSKTSGSRGVYVYNSSETLLNVVVRQVTLEGWDKGIVFQNVDNSTIETNTTQFNLLCGIDLYGSNNTIRNNVIQRNGRVNNQLQCLYENTETDVGICMGSAGFAGPNLIYNNRFDTNCKHVSAGLNYVNTWNVNKQSGTNIMGGPYSGGNYWGGYYSHGWRSGPSDDCADANKDYICDTSYELAVGNVDSYPLKEFPDQDKDGIVDPDDNCPSFANLDQADADGDGVGNKCDNCWTVVNSNQADTNKNCPAAPYSTDPRCGDACELSDVDGDGVPDVNDNCPLIKNSDQKDTDGDKMGNACDHCPNVSNPNNTDSDGDGLGDICDNCPSKSNTSQADADGDKSGDACDECPNDPNKVSPEQCGCGLPDLPDSDHDGAADCIDKCPHDSLKTQPGICGCGVPDNSADGDVYIDCQDNCPKVNNDQTDKDGDGVGDACDNCPDTYNTNQADSDQDFIGDACDNCPDDKVNDVDEDGLCGKVDNCPFVYNPDQSDMDHDGVGDLCDDDIDGDGICNRCWVGGKEIIDNCPKTGNPDQADSDGDRVGDVCDNCPSDPNATWELSVCPWGNCWDYSGTCVETDTPYWKPGTIYKAGFYEDPYAYTYPCWSVTCTGELHCSKDQEDSDSDGVGDACDNCINHPNNQEDADGDGLGDVCDRYPDCFRYFRECQDLDGDGYNPYEGDCNDDNPDIYPGAPEGAMCGVDANCNGVVETESCLERFAPVLHLSTGWTTTDDFEPKEINSMLLESDLRGPRHLTRDGLVTLYKSNPNENDLFNPGNHNMENKYLDMRGADPGMDTTGVSCANKSGDGTVICGGTDLGQYEVPSPGRFNTIYSTSVYGREALYKPYRVLQYWFFYPYNDWWDKHEGDWELVQVILSENTRSPIKITYSWHSGGTTKLWNETDVKKIGTHPEVYVARGSHASYWFEGKYTFFQNLGVWDGFGCSGWTDFTEPVVKTLVPQDNSVWVGDNLINYSLIPISEETSWTNWLGRWGEVETCGLGVLPGNNAFCATDGDKGPRSPQYSGSISKWNKPIDFANNPNSSNYVLCGMGLIELHVYDADGNHVGNAENGDFELKIPGTALYGPGNQMLIVTPKDLLLKIKAIKAGVFDFTFRRYQREIATQTTALYKQIQITENTLATVQFASDNTNYIMEVDVEGDGNIDLTKAPDELIVSQIPKGDLDENVTHTPLSAEEDEDGDGILNSLDNCVNISNPNQADSDNNGIGNACDQCLIKINKNNRYTRSRKVTLQLTTSRDTTGGATICLNSIGSSCESWKPFVESKKIKLPKGDGTKTVYAWVKDKFGVANETPCSNDIILDTKAPSNGTLSATAGDGQVILSWEGFEDENGIAAYKLLYSKGTIPPNCSSGKKLYSGAETSYIHTGLKNGKNYFYRVCATDKAGNTTKGATAIVKPEAP
jgi:parallel beta-helix repeat protein